MVVIEVLLNELKIDILALNETKLDESINCQITDIAGFKQVRLDRSRQGGGISLYVKDSIQYILRNDIPNNNLELLCIEVQPHKSKSFLLIACIGLQMIRLSHSKELKLFYLTWTGKVRESFLWAIQIVIF